MSTQATWSYPTEVRFGAGRTRELAEACVAHGIERPFVVIDPGIASLPVADVLIGGGLNAAVWSDLQANPVGANITAGVDAYRSGRHDGLVAVGGGSALDVGKLVAFMAGQTRPVWDFEDLGSNWTRADTTAIASVIAVPTTAGTGSEVGRASVVINENERRKVIVFHPKMLPVSVICDPELTVGLPPPMTVGTGMDALSHSLEALCSPHYHPMSHGIGLEGCRLVLEHLPRVFADPADIDSRGHMMSAAAMGAVAFQKGLGAMHALSHPIGAHFGTHHGMTNATVMPYVLGANRSAIEPTIAHLAAYVGIGGGFDGFIDHLLDMREDLGVPHTLVDLGADPTATALIAGAAVVDPSAAGNPRELTVTLAAQMFDAACSGTVEGCKS